MRYVWAALLLMLCWLPPTEAATYYISTSDSILATLGSLGPGDTLYLHGGTYNQGINVANGFVPSGSGSGGEAPGAPWPNAITIASAPGETATLQHGINLQHNFNDSIPQYLIFDRLVVDIGGAGESAFRVAADVHHIRLSNSYVGNARDNVLQIIETTHHIEILNSYIHDAIAADNGNYGFTTGMYGIYLKGRNCLVDGNRIYNNSGYAIHQFGSGLSSVTDNVMRNNIIYGNAYSDGDRGSGLDTVILASGSNALFYNNVLYNNSNYNGGSTITIHYGATNAQVYNNTIYGNSGGVSIGDQAASPVIKNNILYGNGGQIADYGASGTVTANNLCGNFGGCGNSPVTGDPSFVSPNANPPDLRLRFGSNAIGAGVNLSSSFTTDADGFGRPSSGGWTIGAFEFASSCVPANCPTGCCGSSCCPPNPDPGTLLLQLLFDEGTGTNAADSSGNNHPCTLTSAGWQIPGNIGPADFLLNGSRSCQINNVTGLTPTAVAISVWIKGTVNPAELGCIYSTGDSIELCIDSGGRPLFTVYTDNYRTVNGQPVVQNGLPHHIVASYSAANGQRLWVDGGQLPMAAGTGNITYPFGTLTQVGRYSTDNFYAYTGVIGNLRVYFGPLMQADVNNLFAEGSSIPQPGTAQIHQQLAKSNAAQTEANLIGALDSDQVRPVTDSTDFIFTITRNGTSTNVHYPLECAVNGGAFAAVTNSFGALLVAIASNSVLNMGDATIGPLPANIQTGGLTPVSGRVVANTINTSFTTLLNNGEYTQWRYTVGFHPSLVGATVECRPDGMDRYDQIKTVTLVGPPSIRSLQGGEFRGVTLQ
jgi:parallel beta-helix repeat protein